MNERLDIVYLGLGHMDATQRRGTHRIAAALSALHNLLFVELDITLNEIGAGLRGPHVIAQPLRRLHPTMAAFTPVYWLPFSRRIRAVEAINKRQALRSLRDAVTALGMRDPILWIDDPYRADYADAIPHRLLVYNVLHEYAKYAHRITDDPRWARSDGETLPPAEIELLRRADLVFCVYKTVLRRRLPYNANCVYMPHGVDLDAYQHAQAANVCPPDLARLPRPIVGHLGGVNADLTDFDLIRQCAKARPEWSFVFVGKHAGGSVINASGDATPEAHLQLPNIHFLGEKPHHEVPAYVVQFDICWITYALNDFIRDIETMKIYEYLASGRPVLTPRLPQLENMYDCLLIYDDAASALDLMEHALKHGDQTLRARREQRASAAAYSERAAAMTRCIRQALDRNNSP